MKAVDSNKIAKYPKCFSDDEAVNIEYDPDRTINSTVTFDNCGSVVIEKDFEITLGSTLNIH